MKKTIIFIIILLLVFLGWFLLKGGQSPAVYKDLLKVNNPLPKAKIASPLTVNGQARGFWFFEASFPVRLYDANGAEIAVAVAQAQGEWMTENFVPFEATLNFNPPATPTGILVLEKDNPSGLPEHADQFKIPMRF